MFKHYSMKCMADYSRQEGSDHNYTPRRRRYGNLLYINTLLNICYYLHVWFLAFAVNALVKVKDSSFVMDELEKAGATDILLFNIANSRM